MVVVPPVVAVAVFWVVEGVATVVATRAPPVVVVSFPAVSVAVVPPRALTAMLLEGEEQNLCHQVRLVVAGFSEAQLVDQPPILLSGEGLSLRGVGPR